MDYTENSDSWRSLIGVHRCRVYAQKDNNAVKRGSHKLRTAQYELEQSDVRSASIDDGFIQIVDRYPEDTADRHSIRHDTRI